MGYPFIEAKSISYGGTRSYESIRYIVIHYTGNNGDTAKNNCDFFKNGNTRSAGAHFFVSQNGDVYQSILMSRVAYSVGGFVTSSHGAAAYYKKCTNTNSISIELCDNANRDPSEAQTEATRKLVQYIRSVCVNAQTIIRHWDVSGKSCPARMTGTENQKWIRFRSAIGSAASTPTPKNEEDPEMTIEEIKKELLKDENFCLKCVETYMEKLSKKAPSQWSEPARKWALENGVFHDNVEWRAPLTREQAAQVFYNTRDDRK